MTLTVDDLKTLPRDKSVQFQTDLLDLLSDYDLTPDAAHTLLLAWIAHTIAQEAKALPDQDGQALIDTAAQRFHDMMRDITSR